MHSGAATWVLSEAELLSASSALMNPRYIHMAKCGFKSWALKYGTYSLIKKKKNTKSLCCEPSWPSCCCGGTDTAAKEAVDLRRSSISLKSERSCIISEQKLCGASQWLSGKEFTCGAEVVGNMGLIPGWERYPGGGHGSPPQYFCLKNLMDRGTNSSNLACSHAWVLWPRMSGPYDNEVSLLIFNITTAVVTWITKSSLSKFKSSLYLYRPLS